MAQAHLIRRAAASEAELARRISAEAYIPAYAGVIPGPPVPAIEDYEPRITLGEVWVLEEAQEAAGVIVLEAKPDHLFVYSLAVTPRFQARGYASALLRFAEEHAHALGLSELRLYTNARMARNIAMYLRAGYAETGRRPHPNWPGETLVDLSKTLPESD